MNIGEVTFVDRNCCPWAHSKPRAICDVEIRLTPRRDFPCIEVLVMQALEGFELQVDVPPSVVGRKETLLLNREELIFVDAGASHPFVSERLRRLPERL